MAATPDTLAEESLSPEMDYSSHEAFWSGFVRFLKWAIAALVVIVLALFSFIEAGNPILGVVLLLLIPVGAIWMMVSGSRTV
jgi:hypothetical protein